MMRLFPIIVMIFLMAKGGLVLQPTNQEEVEVKAILESLGRHDPERREMVIKEIVDRSKQSKSFRSRILPELLGLAEKKPSKAEGQDWNRWADSVQLLGLMKATEAVLVLVDKIDLNDGTVGFSLAHYPAAAALTSIGEPSIQSLSAALQRKRTSARSLAARALSEIGGPKALHALEDAEPKEADPEIKLFMRQAISRLRASQS